MGAFWNLPANHGGFQSFHSEFAAKEAYRYTPRPWARTLAPHSAAWHSRQRSTTSTDDALSLPFRRFKSLEAPVCDPLTACISGTAAV